MKKLHLRALALVTCSALVLSGAAVWRQVSPPRLTLLRETGDRSALAAFPIKGRLDEVAAFTLDDQKLTTHADFSPYRERYFPAHMTSPTLLLRDGGKPTSCQIDLEFQFSKEGDWAVPVLAVTIWEDDRTADRFDDALFGDLDIRFFSGNSSPCILEGETATALRFRPTDVFPDGYGGSTTWQPVENARLSHCHMHDRTATYTLAQAILSDRLYVLAGPTDNELFDAWAGRATLYRLNAPPGAEKAQNCTVDLLEPVYTLPEGRAVLGLAPAGDRLLLLSRAGDDVIVSCVTTDGRLVNEASLAFPASQTRFRLDWNETGDLALLRLSDDDHSSCAALRVSADGVWVSEAISAQFYAEVQFSGEQALLFGSYAQGRSAGLRYQKDGEARPLTRLHGFADATLLDLSGGAPEIVYEATLATPPDTPGNPLPVRGSWEYDYRMPFMTLESR